jgi:hypothetical protein
MSNILPTIFFSIIIIYLIDYLIKYFRDTYTTKKTKDLVGFHIKKYQSIMDKMQERERERERDPSEQSSMKLSEDELLFMNEELDSLIQTELGSP